MFHTRKFHGIFYALMTLALLMVGQFVIAVPADVEPDIPQWVRDRQQYETSYVYVPAETSNARAKAIEPEIPQWVRDRQQYETSYVYVPPQAEATQSTEIVSEIPQWVRDRQQYETSYIYPVCRSAVNVRQQQLCSTIQEHKRKTM